MDDFIDFELTFEQELQAEHARHSAVRSEDNCPLCDEEAEEDGPVSCIGPTGLRVLKEQCNTCIFRPGNLMNLNKGRLKDMVESVEADQTYVICHKTLDQPLGSVCRGSFDNVYTTAIKVAERIGFIDFVDLPVTESEARLLDGNR